MSDAAAIGARIRSLLDARLRSGARDAVLLIHGEGTGAGVVDALVCAARTGTGTRSGSGSGTGSGSDRTGLRGLPPRVTPLAVPRIDAVGIDLWLAAFAWGAAQVWTVVTHEDEAPLREAIALRMRVTEAILAGVGLAGEHLRIIGGGEVSRGLRDGAPLQLALQRFDLALQRPPAASVAGIATFAGPRDGRSLLDLALEHLLANAATPS